MFCIIPLILNLKIRLPALPYISVQTSHTSHLNMQLVAGQHSSRDLQSPYTDLPSQDQGMAQGSPFVTSTPSNNDAY